MQREAYFEFHEDFCKQALELSQKKNHDYAGSDDPFANFRRVEALGVCSTEKGFLVRMIDKLSRLSTFCEKGELQVQNESVKDTLIDLVNYTCLLAAWLEDKDPVSLQAKMKRKTFEERCKSIRESGVASEV